MFIFNTPPKITPTNFPLQPEAFPEQNFKYASLDFAKGYLPEYIVNLLHTAPITNTRKWTLVDVKVHDLKKGQTPCIPGWHCDNTRLDFDDSETDIYHLLVSGGASLTEFMTEEFVVEQPSNYKRVLEDREYSYMKIEPMKWYTYNNFNFHRGTKALYDEKRILLRICESDKIRPRNSFDFRPSYH